MRRFATALLLLFLGNACAHAAAFGTLADLGRALFFDTRLSSPPGMACATCHDPERAFSDPRRSAGGGAVSTGADGRSLGDRNAPALTYLGTVPDFHHKDGAYVGGFFLDGRAGTLQAQVLGPLLNPLEMALPDEAALARRVLASRDYRQALAALAGAEAAAGGPPAVDAITRAIAAFERTAAFSTFDSRFDRHLVGDYVMTRDEAIGRDLFFSSLINCGQCHLNDPDRLSPRETFTNHRYHNIGVPANARIRALNGLGEDHRDEGLGAHLQAGGTAWLGKFRVPGLRNVAVTAPYMHNGAFRTLETAVIFYGKYLLANRPAQTNPETGLPWRPAEVPETVDLPILEDGQPIDAWRVRHLVAFLKTLTDRRYEHLLE